MDSTQIAHDLYPMMRVYRDGRIKRYMGTEIVPPSDDPKTGVRSKDVNIVPETGLSARIYMPTSVSPDHKLPLLVYFHGGGFVVETASSSLYDNHLKFLVSQANIVAVSVDYRLAPEHPLPAAYEDSWAAIKWVASHSKGDGQDCWLKEYVDFDRVFFGGDSAGGNISHNLALRVGLEDFDGFKLDGIMLIHPYFWGNKPLDAELRQVRNKKLIDRIWLVANSGNSNYDDPVLNPGFNPRLRGLGCKRVIVFVAENDVLKDRGWYYKEALSKSGWGGKVEVVETKAEGHVFHLLKPTCDNAMAMVKIMVAFVNSRNLGKINSNI